MASQMTKTEITKLVFEGRKWEVKPSMTVRADDTLFVKLPKMKPLCCGFARMCCKGVAGDVSLAASEGYRLLMKLRNNAQSAELQNESSPVKAEPAKLTKPKQSLLKDMFAKQRLSEDESAAKRARLTREEIHQKREQPSSILVMVPAFGEFEQKEIRVLRPVNGRDDLAVQFDVDARGLGGKMICFYICATCRGPV